MHLYTRIALTITTALVYSSNVHAKDGDDKIIAEATGGALQSSKGSYIDSCGQSNNFTAEVIDLNGDGQAEVFTSRDGSCEGGMAGSHISLYIKNNAGKWVDQFGFPGIYNILSTKNKGYPDIEIGGPGMCFPIWRWHGHAYEIHKKCPI
jgi:hypothetical protein